MRKWHEHTHICNDWDYLYFCFIVQIHKQSSHPPLSSGTSISFLQTQPISPRPSGGWSAANSTDACGMTPQPELLQVHSCIWGSGWVAVSDCMVVLTCSAMWHLPLSPGLWALLCHWVILQILLLLEVVVRGPEDGRDKKFSNRWWLLHHNTPRCLVKPTWTLVQQTFMAISLLKTDYSDAVIQSIRDLSNEGCCMWCPSQRAP